MGATLFGVPWSVVYYGLPLVCAPAAGFIWRRKGGDLADGIALGGILTVLGVAIAVVRRPRRRQAEL